MLQLNDVSLRRGSLLLFEHANLQVHGGQRLGVVGANGSGKSSLFALILDEIESDQGSVHHPASDVIAHVAQESPSSEHSAIDHVLDGDPDLRGLQRQITHAEDTGQSGLLPDLYEKMHAIDGYAAEQRAARLLHGLGFSDQEMRQPVRTFSGGWRMRLNLAQALMCRSDILLLDEPTNHLDLPAILWLERWLMRYPGILLLVSHDRDFLDAVCTHVAHIEHQEIRSYSGNYSRFEQVRSEQLALQQAMYERQQKEIRHIQSFVDRFRAKATKARQAQSRLKSLERMTKIVAAHVDSPFHFRFLEPEKQPQHLLNLDVVDAGYDKPVLTGVDINIVAGDRIGLLGVNGAGKSTLVKALADGSTLLSGERHLSKDCRIGYFAQHQLDQLDPTDSPAGHLLQQSPGLREQELRNFLGGFGFQGDRVFEPVAPFSGGEKARLVLALLVQQCPNLLLLDEPTNHLDLDMRHALSLALAEYSGALVVISHDRHLLRSVCDDFQIVHDGSVNRFREPLDAYPEWLREQEKQGAIDNSPVAEKPRFGKRQLRQEQAQRRARLKPWRDRIRKLDNEMARIRIGLELIEKQLADDSLYGNSEKQQELTELIKKQGGMRSRLESAEHEWLEASEALDQAESAE